MFRTGLLPLFSWLRTSASIATVIVTAIAMMAALSACGPAKNVPKREKPVANTQHSEVTATGPVVADGVATSTIHIVIRDQNAQAMPGLQPVVNASGTGNRVQACSVTDVNGASSCAMSSTVAEIKTVNLSAPVAVAGAAVEFVAGPAVKLGFSTQPSNSTEGQSFVRQPRVDVQDAQGNRVPTAVNSITLAIAAGSSGTLNGTKVLAAVAGRSSYSALNVSGIASPAQIRLSASASGLTAATSEPFSVVPDTGSTLAFDTQPGGGGAGVVWAAQPVVHILDSGGSLLTTGTAAVTLTLTSGSGALLGTSTVNAVSGIATFSGLKMEVVGAKQMTATSPGSANVISSSFTIVPGAPTSLAFSTQPGGGSANQVWSQQPVVRLFDAYGNLCVSSSETVALSLQTGTGSLSGTTSLAATSGVATYSGLKMTLAGQKSLRATAGTLFIDSNSFMIGSGTAAVLKFATQPGGGTAGVAWAQQPVVEVLDDQNNRVTSFGGTVGLSLTTGSGSLAVSLAAVSGVATFSGLKMNTAGTGKILSAGITGVTGVTSTAFAVVHNTPSQLVVRTHPSTNDLANTNLSIQPELDLKDAFGNLITSGVDAGAPIVASLYSGGGAVLGNSTLAFNAGQVSFLGLRMSAPGAKVLKFTKPNATPFGGTGEMSVNSNSFNAIVGNPAKLAYATLPGGGTAGVAWLQQPAVEIQDVAGNRVTTMNGTIAIAHLGGTGPLLGTATAVASSGVATFTNLRYNVAGTNKTVRASMGTLAMVTSGTFAVVHGMAAQLAFTQTAGTGTITTNLSPQPRVEIRDAYANRVTTGPDATTYITASLQSGTGPLTGTTMLAASAGVVTFTNLRIGSAGSKVLRFTKDDSSAQAGGTGVLTLDSAPITINPGVAASLAVLAQPTQAQAGLAFTTQPQIEFRDSAGNRATTTNGTVSVTLQSGTGSLLGTASVVAASGVASFSGLQMEVSGDKVLRFTSGAMSVNSASFRVASGIATSIEVVTEPDGATVEQAFVTQPVLRLRDSYNNLVEDGVDATANVMASLLTGTPGLSGQLTAAAVNGVVTYSNLAATSVGVKRIRFTKADLSGSGGSSTLTQNSASFTVDPAAGAELVFNVQPGGGTAGIAWSQQPKVEIRDVYGNVDTASTAAVSLAVTTGSGSLEGVATVNAVSGVATFSGLHVDAMGAGKVLTATAASLASASSSAFNVVAGAPVASSDISISNGPKWSNGTDAYTVSVTLRDAFGNPVAGKSVALASARGAQDTITSTPATSGVGGDVSFAVTSSVAGTGSLTASVVLPAVTIAPTVNAVFDDFKVSAVESRWGQDRVSLAADGSTLLTLSGVLKNAAGVALPNKSYTLTSSRSGADVIAAANSGATDASGNYSVTVKSATTGISRLTLGVAADAVNITQAGRAQFLAKTPYSEYVPSLAQVDALKMGPGSNIGPVSTWADVASGGSADLSLLGFAWNSTSSGWMGDGNTTISNGLTGPYRLGFDGSGDGANGGTSFNSLSAMTFELWARPGSAATGRTLIGNANGANGMWLRNAADGSGRWEVRLGTGAIYNEVVAADSPTSYWRMNETSGTTVTPQIGSTSGTYTGAVTLGRAGGLASSDRAAEFNGSSSWAAFGNTHEISGEFTLEAWTQLSTTTLTNPRAIAAKASASGGYALEIDANRRATFSAYIAGEWKTATGTTVMEAGVYYHIVGIKQDAACVSGLNYSVAIYVNGVREGCTDYSIIDTTYTSTGNSFRIGDHEGYGNRRFPGRIDDVAVYGALLSEARILAHFNSGRNQPHCYSATPVTTNKWAHLVASFDSATQNLRLQIDGTEVCNVIGSGVTLNGSSAALGIGARLSAGSVVGGSEWTGAVGDIRIYDSATNATDANTNYGAQSSRYPD